MSCRPVIFDPMEWIYVMKLAWTLLPELSFREDLLATQTAGRLGEVDIRVLKDLDWGEPVVYMPPFEKTAYGTVVVAVEGYTVKKLQRHGVKADVVVSDMDFEPDGLSEVRHVVMHIHGDNYWKVPKRGWIYTVQTWPIGCTHNISGFTDGDRAIYLAYYMGAKKVTISGFYPQVAVKRDDWVKRKKLKIASHLVERLARRIDVKLF
ncbi:MAG: hypothetical protein ACK4M3_04730 [Pyrobaculum sp.]